ncbi:putative DNA binding protein [Tripterygium wilfordii]|uniref:Putative DNA binding protein n=1 Tax=Tripterygium wilfordii TaxID=458696 RepID=A0A7J7CJF6_TRIWF|nr:putative DNA binding protein [Tripterygium wilfordii]
MLTKATSYGVDIAYMKRYVQGNVKVTRDDKGKRIPVLFYWQDSARLNVLKNTVDDKIQTICQKVRRERAKKLAKKRNSDNNVITTGSNERVGKVDSSSSSSSVSTLGFGESWGREWVSPTISEELFWNCENSPPSVSTDYPIMVPEETELEGCSLAKMPSFDPEIETDIGFVSVFSLFLV